jgi:transposase
MVFVQPLQEQERQQLKRLARREVGRVSERICMILLSSRGHTVPQIAQIFECDDATVRSWIERLSTDGIEGLRDRPRAGDRGRRTQSPEKPSASRWSAHRRRQATSSDSGRW